MFFPMPLMPQQVGLQSACMQVPATCCQHVSTTQAPSSDPGKQFACVSIAFDLRQTA